MSATDIFNKAQPKYNIQPFNLAMPRIPTASQVYLPYNNKQNQQNQPNPSDYVVDVLKILPINAQHLSNPTNGFAYTSMADVVLNKEAWKKRWGADSWLTTPLGYLPRVLADTGLLLKDTIINPVVDSVRLANADKKDDLGLFKGLQAGINTAVLNTLINLGYTLDTIANPVKGLIIDGSEGLKKATIGDSSTGRKNYDMGEYIDFGKGLGAGTGEFLTSAALEFILDPVNWVSLGTAGLAKAGANAATDAATSGLKTALTGFAKSGISITDDLATELVEQTGKRITKETAESILKQIADDSGKITADAVEKFTRNLDDFTESVIARGIKDTQFGNKNSFTNQLRNQTHLMQSKGTRYKAGLFSGKAYTPTVQSTTADLLSRIDISKLPSVTHRSLQSRKVYNLVEKGLRDVAGLGSGWTEVIAGKKLIDKFGAHLNNIQLERLHKYMAENPEEFAKTISVLDNEYKIDFDKAVDEIDFVKGHTSVSTKLKDTSDKLDNIFDNSFTEKLFTLNKKAIKKPNADDLLNIQKECIAQLDEAIESTLGESGVHTFDEYVKYIQELADRTHKSSALHILNRKVQGMYTALTDDVTNTAVLKKYLNTARVYQDVVDNTLALTKRVQQENLDTNLSDIARYRKLRKVSKEAKIVDPIADVSDTELTEATNEIINEADTLIDRLPKQLNTLWTDRYPDTADAVTGLSTPNKVIENNYTLNEAYTEFIEDYNILKTRLDTLYNLYRQSIVEDSVEETTKLVKQIRNIQYDLIETYTVFVKEHLEPLTKFSDDINATNASEIRNALGETAMRVSAESTRTGLDGIPMKMIGRETRVAEIADNIELIKTQDYPNLYKLFGDVLDTPKDSTTTIEDVFDELYLRLQQIDETSDNFEDTLINKELIQSAQEELDKLYEFYNTALYDVDSDIVEADKLSLVRTLFNIKENIGAEYHPDIKVVKPLKTFDYAKATVTAEDVGDYIRSLKLYPNIIKETTQEVDLAKYYTNQMVSYTLGASQTTFALGLIEGFKEDGAGSGLPKVLDLYEDHNSNLYKMLNSDMYKNDTEVIDFKNTLQRLSGFRTLVNNVTRLLDDMQLDTIHKEGILDRIVTNIQKNHGFKEWNLEEIARDIVDGSNQYFRSHTGTESLAMDNLLFRTAKEVLDSQTSGTRKQLAGAILNTLAQGTAHASDVDNINLWRYLQLDNSLKASLDAQAGTKYRVIFDMEAIDSSVSKENKIFQISALVIDSNGNQVDTWNWIVKPEGKKPLRNVLRKLAPGDAADLDKWWLDNIVNNPDAVDSTTAFTKFYTKLKALDDEAGVMLVGQNIEGFDIPLLLEHVDDTFKTWLTDTQHFDTLTYMINGKYFEIQGSYKERMIARLTELLRAEHAAENATLTHKLYTWYDVYNMSNIKKMLREAYTNETQAKRILTDDTHIKTLLAEITELENAIDSVTTQWREARTIRTLFRRMTDSGYFTVTKATITSDEVRKFLEGLIEQGLINVPLGTNISTFLNKYVSAANVWLNAKTAISYELTDVFDLMKIKAKHGAEGVEGCVVAKQLAEHLTHQSRCIKNNMSWLTDDVVDVLYPDAKEFLASLKDYGIFKDNYADLIYDAADNNKKLIVAAAVYYNNKLGNNASDRFKNIGALKASLQKSADGVDYKTAPLLHTLDDAEEAIPLRHLIDEKTHQPVELYSDSKIYSYIDVAESQKHNPFDIINQYNVDQDIYNAHSLALHELYKHNSALAVDVERVLNKYNPAAREKVERQIRSYGKKLAEAAKEEVLNRENRVTSFIAEAKLRAGRFVFTDTRQLDLSDFKNAGVLVEVVTLTDKDGNTYYRYWLGHTEEMYNSAEVISIKSKMFKDSDIPESVYNLIYRARQQNAAFVKNIGWSNGDIADKELLQKFDDLMPESFKGKIVSLDRLQSDHYFDSLNANNSILWGTDLKDLFEVHLTSDPFNQAFYNTQAYVKTHLGKLSSFIHLLYNEANGINTSKLFKGFSNAELYKLCKQNPDIKWCVLVPSTNKWAQTATGVAGTAYRLQEVKIVNEKSIKLLRKLNAHAIPNTMYLQMTNAINTFQLPPIARIANNISTFYKLGYLSSIGFIVRNIIDSNYKNRWALDGNVSLPKQVSHLFTTIKLIQRYNETGLQFTKYVGHHFKNDLEYSVFYNICKHIDDTDIITTIKSLYPEHLHKKVDTYLTDVLNTFNNNKAILRDLSETVIEPDLFSVMHVFINNGPSAGLSRSILNNIASTNNNASVSKKVVKWITEDSPAKFIYDWNDMVEQSARLSLFLQRLEMGDTVDLATRAVIKTHFDYSDKTLGMLYTEILFPFMSFSYKNLNFWMESLSENPKLARELSNILMPCLDYQSLFNPDQEAYNNFDYSFDWSKDVMCFEARAPWQLINAARLYHILSGNIVIDTGKTVRYDNGYGEKDNELLAVFKLSPSVLDAVRMLYNPIDTYQQRLLPPYEVLSNTFINVLNGKAPIEDLGINTLLNNLPFVGATLQRAGYGKPNSINRRIQDAGLPMAISSLFTAAYVPKKDKYYWYDGDYNKLNPTPHQTYYSSPYYNSGGFTPNYSARRNYSNPYNSRVPTYTINKLARRTPNKSLYSRSTRYSLKNNYSTLLKNGVQDNLIRKRVLDKFRYFN